MGNFLLLGNFITKSFRDIIFLLDSIVYSLAKIVFSVFCYLSEITILDPDLITNFTSRVYAVIGLVMIFVLAYNLLNYIIDPDKINDKSMGAAAFIKNVIFALVIITATPTLFVKLYAFQNTIITSGVISNIIIGGFAEEENNPGMTYIEQGANDTVVNVFGAFFFPNDFSVLDCMDSEFQTNEYCVSYANAKAGDGLSAFANIIEDEDNYTYYIVFSTAAGIVLTFFMLSYCINLAIRVGKMAVLQLIAPIPALLELVPGKGGTRKTWFETLIKTYLDVFMYQATVFVVIYFITFIPKIIKGIFAGVAATGAGLIAQTFTMVLLMFGLFQFGKEVPKLLSSLLGLKDTGEFGKVAKRALAMGGVTGGLLGSTVGRFARGMNSAPEGANGFQKVARGFGEAGSGIARTLWSARNVHDLKGAKELRTKVNQDVITARVKRDAYAFSHPDGVLKGHYTDFKDSMGAKARAFWGTQNEFEEKQLIEKINNEMKTIYNTEIRDNIYKKDGIWNQLDSTKNQYNAALEAAFANAQQQGYTGDIDSYKNSFTWQDAGGNTWSAESIKNAIENRQAALRKDNIDKVSMAVGKMQNLASANQGVPGMSAQYHAIEDLFDANGVYDDSKFTSFETEFKKNGFTKELDKLKANATYQQEKVGREIAKDAAEQVKKAAAEANNKDKKDK